MGLVVDGPDDVAADRALVERIVNEVVSEFGARSEKEDLFQAGYEGLLEKKPTYDPDKGVPFAGYAYRRIRGAMLETLRKSKKLPRRALERCQRAQRLEEVLEQASQDGAKAPPTGDLDATAKISALMGMVAAAYTADVVASAERHGTEEGLITQLDAAKVHGAIQQLPDPPHRTVILSLYFEEQRLAEIGAGFRKSESWASRAHTEALDMLREALS